MGGKGTSAVCSCPALEVKALLFHLPPPPLWKQQREFSKEFQQAKPSTGVRLWPATSATRVLYVCTPAVWLAGTRLQLRGRWHNQGGLGGRIRSGTTWSNAGGGMEMNTSLAFNDGQIFQLWSAAPESPEQACMLQAVIILLRLSSNHSSAIIQWASSCTGPVAGGSC